MVHANLNSREKKKKKKTVTECGAQSLQINSLALIKYGS